MSNRRPRRAVKPLIPGLIWLLLLSSLMALLLGTPALLARLSLTQRSTVEQLPQR